MRTDVQILYGPYNMSNKKCRITGMDERNLPSQVIQDMVIARQDGSIKVADRYRKKAIRLDGYLQLPTSSSNTFREIENEFDNSVSKKSRDFRVARRWLKMFDLDSDSGWTGGGDTVNITTDAYNYMVSTASLNFDVDVSYSVNDYATLENNSLTAVDLSSVEDSGNIEFWMFLENSTNIEDIDFRFGNDDSNYWYANSVTTNYEDNTLETGWNYMSLPWSGFSEVGSPDASEIDYVYISLNYSSDQDDSQNNKLSGIRWIDEDEVTVYQADSTSVTKQESNYHIDYQPFTIILEATKGLATSTHEISAVSVESFSSLDSSSEFRALGSYRPNPKIVYTVDSASDLREITYRNESSDQQITVSASDIETNDIIEIDTDKLTCLRNGQDAEYTGVFPKHIIGRNEVTTRLGFASQDLQSQEEQDTEYVGSFGNTYLAQSFQPELTGTLEELQLYLRLVQYGATAAGWLVAPWVRPDVYSDSGGEPDTHLADFNAIMLNSSDFLWYTSTGSLAVTSGTTYWIVAQLFYDYPTDAIYSWGANSGGGYASGSVQKSSDLSSWTAGSGDLSFKAYTQPAASAYIDWDVTYKKRYV